MRIAMVSTPWYETPPVAYGGIESVVAKLVDELVDRGHDVMLVGAGRARTRAQHFVAVYREPPSDRIGTGVPEVVFAAAAARALEGADVDVVHDHSLAGPLLAASRAAPTVMTMHGPVAGEHGDYVESLGRYVRIVAISDAQWRQRPSLHWVGRVHNAVDVDDFTTREDVGDYVLWVGRFTRDKGPDLAIDAARAAGRPIVLAGKCTEPDEQNYFDAEIAPRLGPGVEYAGEVGCEAKKELFGRARALVFPIRWDEPFGMVMAEAMASGTPVVATRRGSVAELVADGVSGVVLDADSDAAAIAEGIQVAERLDRDACRKHARTLFSVAAMATGYERVYDAVR